MKSLEGKRVAILATDGFEHSEFFKPLKAIKEAGGLCEVVSPEKKQIKSWKDNNWGESCQVDQALSDVSPQDYDALILPGGVINADLLRNNSDAVEFVKGFFQEGSQKPVAAICHAPWILAEAGVLQGRKMTSYSSLKTDLRNAGAEWTDAEVMVDKGLVTSRMPKDLDAFNKKMIEEIKEGRHTMAS